MGLLLVCSDLSAKDHPLASLTIESALQGLTEKQESILIDVRNSKEFEKFRIPGSINIPLFAIKTKTFLKSKPLVVMNEGQSYRQLLQECAILSAAGFNARLLDGGLYQWKGKGGPLEGDVFAQRELNKISPQTFLAGQAYENWIVVDVSQTGKADADLANLRRSHLPYSDSPGRFISELKSLLRNEGMTEFFSAVICDEKGDKYERIEKHISDAGIISVLYLKGGFEGYRVFKQQQTGIQKGKTSDTRGTAVKTYRNCTTCP